MKCGKPCLFYSGKSALPNNQAGLEVGAAIDKNQHVAVIDPPERLIRVVRFAADAKPEHIDWGPDIHYFEFGRITNGRAPTVATNDKVGFNFHFSFGCLHANAPDDFVVFLQKTNDLIFHTQVESGETLSLLGKKIKKVPLGHQRNEFALHWQMGKVRCRE